MNRSYPTSSAHYPVLNPSTTAHRTRTTGRSSLRLAPVVRCLTLAGPGIDYTGRTDSASGASVASVRCVFLSEKTLPRLLQISHRRNRKYAFHFLKNPSSLYPSNSTSFSKCANTTECVPTSARVSAFSQSFSLKELS